MPKHLPLRQATPMSVLTATQVFDTELRLQLIHHYRTVGGQQVEAAKALGVERAVVSYNTRALVELGVLIRHPDRSYTVDEARVRDLLRALEQYTLGHHSET